MYTINYPVMMHIELPGAVWSQLVGSYPAVADSVFRKMVKKFPGVDDSHIKIGEPTFQEAVLPYCGSVRSMPVTQAKFMQITIPITDLAGSYVHLSEDMFKIPSILQCSVDEYVIATVAAERRKLEARVLLDSVIWVKKND